MIPNNEYSFFFLKEHNDFLSSSLYKEIKKDFKHLFLDFYYENIETTNDEVTKFHRDNCFKKSVLFYSIFIYINSIINKSHSKIADIGCGYNFLKKYFPNVIGYDRNEFADCQELFDEKFILKHRNEFDVAISINSLHFISLKDFSSCINDFGKIINNSGYGFITFNLERMIERTDENFLKNYKSLEDFYDYINQEIEKINYKIVAYDNLLLYNRKLVAEKRYKLYNDLHGVDWPSFDDLENNSYVCKNYIISKEIENYYSIIKDFGLDTERDDPFNGNIRLIFQKEDK